MKYLSPKVILFISLLFACIACQQQKEEIFIDFIVNSVETKIEFFWKNEKGEVFGSIQKLKEFTEANGKKLRFAMNAGIYDKGDVPLGLYIENGEVKVPLNTKKGEGNFYLQPNGVFYLKKDGRGVIVKTSDFVLTNEIIYATQSGPMLLIDGQINSEFREGSNNLNIRNGVCILDSNKIVFTISRSEVNLYDFAKHFKDLGCQNALYLDGFVSRMYLPEKNIEQLDGDFSVIIGVTE